MMYTNNINNSFKYADFHMTSQQSMLQLYHEIESIVNIHCMLHSDGAQ